MSTLAEERPDAPPPSEPTGRKGLGARIGAVRQDNLLLSGGGVALGALVFCLAAVNEYQLTVGINVGIYAIAALGLTVVVGQAGQLALGQAGFMAIGGYTVAYSTLTWGWPFLPALLAGTLLALGLGLLLGWIALRLRATTWRWRRSPSGRSCSAWRSSTRLWEARAGCSGSPHLAARYRPRLAARPVRLRLDRRPARVRPVLAVRARARRQGAEGDAGRSVGRRDARREHHAAEDPGLRAECAAGRCGGGNPRRERAGHRPDAVSTPHLLPGVPHDRPGRAREPRGAVAGTAIVVWLVELVPGTGDWAYVVLGVVVVVAMAVAPGGLASVVEQLTRVVRRARSGRAGRRS